MLPRCREQRTVVVKLDNQVASHDRAAQEGQVDEEPPGDFFRDRDAAVESVSQHNIAKDQNQIGRASCRERVLWYV